MSDIVSESSEEVPSATQPPLATIRESIGLISLSQVGLFVIVLGFVLHQMKPVLLPIVLAVLVSLVVYPVYLGFRKLLLPRILAALFTVLGLLGLLVFGLYQAALPGAGWAERINEEQVVSRVQEVFRPVKEVKAEIEELADRVDAVTSNGTGEVVDEIDAEANPTGAVDQSSNDRAVDPSLITPDSAYEGRIADPETSEDVAEKSSTAPVVVEVRENRVSGWIEETQRFGLLAVAFLLLVLFILAYGNRIASAMNDDPTTGAILSQMGSEVSRYLFTITVINACLGLCIGLAMWALGMPSPILWGVLGMLMNFIPYVGAFVGSFAVFLVAVASFDSPGLAIAPSLVYFILTAIEGNIVTPVVLGDRFQLNPLVVFVWIFAWAGFWGVAGMLIAMPTLVTFSIACENLDTMAKFRRILKS